MNDPLTISLSGTFLVTTSFYWASALIFMLIDYTQKPAFLMKYKIQPGKNIPPDTKQVIKVSGKKEIDKIFCSSKAVVLNVCVKAYPIPINKESIKNETLFIKYLPSDFNGD